MHIVQSRLSMAPRREWQLKSSRDQLIAAAQEGAAAKVNNSLESTPPPRSGIDHFEESPEKQSVERNNEPLPKRVKVEEEPIPRASGILEGASPEAEKGASPKDEAETCLAFQETLDGAPTESEAVGQPPTEMQPTESEAVGQPHTEKQPNKSLESQLIDTPGSPLRSQSSGTASPSQSPLKRKDVGEKESQEPKRHKKLREKYQLMAHEYLNSPEHPDNVPNVGVSPFTPSYLLDSVMDCDRIMASVWKDVLPRIDELLSFCEPLQFTCSNSQANPEDKAWTQPWNREQAKEAFNKTGKYMASACFHWLNVAEQPGDMASWTNILLCARQFWSSPNDDAPHIIGWVKDPAIFDINVVPHSIYVRGCFELLGGLGVQLQRICDDEHALRKWMRPLRCMIVTVYKDTEKTPLKGIGIAQARDLAVREQTQALIPLRQAIQIVDVVSDIPGNKGIKTPAHKVATFFKTRGWAPKEWHSEKCISAMLAGYQTFVMDEEVFVLMKRMHLQFGTKALHDSIYKLGNIAQVIESRADLLCIFLRVLLVAMKRRDWLDCGSLTMNNLKGNASKGVMPLPLLCLLQECIASWFCKEFEVAPTVSSKMQSIESWDQHFPCLKEQEQRSEQVSTMWQTNIIDEKDKKAIAFLSDIHKGVLNGDITDCYRYAQNWKDAMVRPGDWFDLYWHAPSGGPRVPGKLQEYIQEMQEMKKRKEDSRGGAKGALTRTQDDQAPEPEPKSSEGEPDPESGDAGGIAEAPPLSEEELQKQALAQECMEKVQVLSAETIKFVHMQDSAGANEVGQTLQSIVAVNEFSGNYDTHRRGFIFDCTHLPEHKFRPWRQVPVLQEAGKQRLHGLATYLKRGDFIFFFDGGHQKNSQIAQEVIMSCQKAGKKVIAAEFCLVYDVQHSKAWSRKRGFGGAQNTEKLIVMSLEWPMYKMKNKDHTLGGSTWFSNALTGLERVHPSWAVQMDPEDKKRLYAMALSGREVDVRPKTCESDSQAKKLRLGTLRGCCPMTWFPRSPAFTKALINDWDLKMVVDCYAGDGSWAIGNLMLSSPTPYVGLTMSQPHTYFLTKITTKQLKKAMATAGHTFCDDDSLDLITKLYAELVKDIDDPPTLEFPKDDDISSDEEIEDSEI